MTGESRESPIPRSGSPGATPDGVRPGEPTLRGIRIETSRFDETVAFYRGLLATEGVVESASAGAADSLRLARLPLGRLASAPDDAPTLQLVIVESPQPEGSAATDSATRRSTKLGLELEVADPPTFAGASGLKLHEEAPPGGRPHSRLARDPSGNPIVLG